MAEQNPIKYSDLISPDDSIEKLIGQLENLQTAYEGMASSVQQRAASIASSLKTVSGATEQGRRSTKDASDEASRLEKAYKQLDAALGQNAKEIARLNEIKREANNYNKNMVKLGGEEIKTREQIAQATYNQLSAQYSLNKAYINSLNAEEREIKANKDLIKTTNDIYEQMKKLQEATGKYSLNVGNYTNSISQAIGMNSKWYQGLQQVATLTEGGLANGLKTAGAAVGTLGKQLLALLANPIVATIAAIAAAFMALAKGISTSEENTNALARVLAPFKRILEGVLNVLQSAATYVLKVAEGFEGMAMKAAKLLEKLPLVGNAIGSVNRALEKNIALEKEKQALQKDGRELTKQEAKLEWESAVLRRKAAQTNDPREQEALLNKAIRKEKERAEMRIDYTQRELNVLREKAKQSQNDSALNDEIAQKEAELYRLRAQEEQRTLRMVRQVQTARNKMNKENSGGGSTNTGASDVDLAKQRLEEQRKIEDARIALIDDANLRERMTIIASYERKIEDLQGNAEYIQQMTLLLEQQKQSKLADLLEKEAKQQEDAEKKKKDAQVKVIQDAEKAREAAVKAAEKQINDAYDLDVSIADLEASENKKTQMRLEAEKKRMAALLALYEKDGKMLTETELQILRNGMALVNQEIEKNTKNRDVYDMLGLNLNDEQKQAMTDSFNFALDQLSSYIDAWVQAADQKAQLAQKEVEHARSVVDAEIEARNKGYASNVAEAQRELELAKQTQRKALQEKQKAQRAQQALDSITQASSLVTASAEIWKSFAGLGPFGVAAAVAAIALMWGSFAAAKIKAAQLTRGNTEEYGEGTVELLQGGSHQSGNDIDLGRKADGTRRRAEGGEFFAVINKRNSRKFREVIPSVIGSLNDGTFAEKYMQSYDGGGVAVSVQSEPTDIRGLSSDVRRIREQGETSSYFDGNGNEIIRYKNVKRIVKS